MIIFFAYNSCANKFLLGLSYVSTAVSEGLFPEKQTIMQKSDEPQ